LIVNIIFCTEGNTVFENGNEIEDMNIIDSLGSLACEETIPTTSKATKVAPKQNK